MKQKTPALQKLIFKKEETNNKRNFTEASASDQDGIIGTRFA